MAFTIKGPDMDENELAKIIISYDDGVQCLLEERKNLLTEKCELEIHIKHLERHFQNRLQKY